MRLILLAVGVLIVSAASTACGRAADELNRARGDANEAGAIANIRIALSAEAAYSAGNGGGARLVRHATLLRGQQYEHLHLGRRRGHRRRAMPLVVSTTPVSCGLS